MSLSLSGMTQVPSAPAACPLHRRSLCSFRDFLTLTLKRSSGWVTTHRRMTASPSRALLATTARGGLGSRDLIAEPEAPSFISRTVARSRLDRLRS